MMMFDVNIDKRSVYGFITNGPQWQFITYDGTFKISEDFNVMFPTMIKKGGYLIFHS